MPRLIDANEILKSEHQHYDYMADEYYVTVRDIENAPTVDIDAITESHERIGDDKGFRDGYAQATSEVRHGRWIVEKWINTIFCSECGNSWHIMDNDTETFVYCPNCGCKMDLKGEGDV